MNLPPDPTLDYAGVAASIPVLQDSRRAMLFTLAHQDGACPPYRRWALTLDHTGVFAETQKRRCFVIGTYLTVPTYAEIQDAAVALLLGSRTVDIEIDHDRFHEMYGRCFYSEIAPRS